MLVKIERTNKKNFDTLKMCFDVTNLEQTLDRPLPSHRAGPSPDKSGHSVSVNIFPSTEHSNSSETSGEVVQYIRYSTSGFFLTHGTYKEFKECYYTLVLV